MTKGANNRPTDSDKRVSGFGKRVSNSSRGVIGLSVKK